MTLGATPQFSEVVAELGEGLPYTMPDARTRWLADVGATSAVTLPNSFAGKQSVKLVALADKGGESGPTISYTGMNFGLAFPGRVLIACFALSGINDTGNPGVFDANNITIGGLGTVGETGGEFNNPAQREVSNGIWAVHADTLGTSGTVSISNISRAVSGSALAILSVSSISSTANDYSNVNPSGAGASSISDNMDVPGNGVLVMTTVSNGGGGLVGFSGCTLRATRGFGGGLLAIGFDNRLGAQGGRSISASWNSTAFRNLEAQTFAQ